MHSNQLCIATYYILLQLYGLHTINFSQHHRLCPMHCMYVTKSKLELCRIKPDWVWLSMPYCLAHVCMIKWDLCRDKFTLNTTWRITLKIIIPVSSIILIKCAILSGTCVHDLHFMTEMHRMLHWLHFVHCTANVQISVLRRILHQRENRYSSTKFTFSNALHCSEMHPVALCCT